MKWNCTGVGGKSIHFYKILIVITSTNFPWNYVCAHNDYRCILLHWNIKKECKIKIWCSKTLSREREREREERASKSEIDILSVSIYVSKIPNGNIKHKVISSGQSKLDRKCYLFINMWSIYLLHCNLSEYTTHINGCICRSLYTVTIYLLEFYKEFEKFVISNGISFESVLYISWSLEQILINQQKHFFPFMCSILVCRKILIRCCAMLCDHRIGDKMST